MLIKQRTSMYRNFIMNCQMDKPLKKLDLGVHALREVFREGGPAESFSISFRGEGRSSQISRNFF